jgi:hypothetical protein
MAGALVTLNVGAGAAPRIVTSASFANPPRGIVRFTWTFASDS